MNQSLLVIGGCRSGKSRYALECAEAESAMQRIFVATSIPSDNEMTQRVRQHQAERGDHWSTLEEPVHVPRIVRDKAMTGRVLLVDCITLWISNLLHQSLPWEDFVADLVASVSAATGPVILVTNEVGQGIVPENSLARRFRDVAGVTNQRLAGCAATVVWMVAGIPVCIKGKMEPK
jgi:adenosylcobinamide kinase / adenosylcobinamide-phosphate guanylyltransferase